MSAAASRVGDRPPRAPIRVAVVDDSRDQRAGWILSLGSQQDLEVVGQAGDGAQALALLRRVPVDVVLMDVQMPRVSGLVAAERIRSDARVLAHGPAPRVILLEAVDVDRHVPEAAIAGAYAVLAKDVHPEALFIAIREAAAFDDTF